METQKGLFASTRYPFSDSRQAYAGVRNGNALASLPRGLEQARVVDLWKQARAVLEALAHDGKVELRRDLVVLQTDGKRSVALCRWETCDAATEDM